MSLFSYHNKPPFMVDNSSRSGLYYDFASYLNLKQDQYTFEVIYVPRKRLDRLIESDELNGFVIGVSPVWFKDKEEAKYLWLDSFYDDRDEFVSLKTSPFNYVSKQSFNDKTVVGVAGFYYFGINESVDAGNLLRIDTIGELQSLQLIEEKRADFAIVSRSVFNYLKAQNSLQDIYHMSPIPHDQFNRRLLTTKNNKALHEKLAPIMKAIKQDQLWLDILAKYE